MTTRNAQQAQVNGIDVESLLATVRAVQATPGLGEFQFRASNRWLGGTKNRSTIQGFYGAGREDDSRSEPYVMDCDEPPVLCGRDEGANPVEYLLNALAGCMTTTMVAHAASRGIAIESLSSKLEGDIDVRGFLGIAPEVTKGYRAVRVTFQVRSDADAAALEKLARMSPVFNTVTQPTPVEVRIEKV